MSSASGPGRPASPAMPPQRPAKRQPTIRSQVPQTSSPLASTSTTSLSAPSQPVQSSALASTSSLAHPPHDPAIDRALQLSTFESGYSPESFISTLSTSLISTSKSSAGPFDPSPFLQVFSPALDSLLKLRGEVAERTKKMETDVRRAEREYGRRLRELDGGFEAIGSSFESLEERITDVGRTAVRIGEQLEGLHQTRSTAQSTSLIVSYYLSLAHSAGTTDGTQSNGDGTEEGGKKAAGPLEALFATRTSREGRAKLAVILRRLMAVAKDMADNSALAALEAESQSTPNLSSSPNTGEEGKAAVVDQRTLGRRRKEKEKAERVRDEVERYCERFEKEVLRLFDRSYRKGDPRMMAHCAKTLQDFNGGASCVQIYVNQHDFFISHGKVVEEAEKSLEEEGEDGTKRVDIWKTIGNPDAPPPTNEPGLDALIREIKITTSQEAQIVKAVFPDPVAVATVFIQRVFAQVLQQHIESLVSRAQSISTLAVLRILNLCHSNCSTLVDDLRSYDLALSTGSTSSTGQSTPTAGTGPSASNKGSAGTGAGAGGPLSNMLDHALEEMFVPWLEGSRYLESESKNLVELYGGLLSRFTRYHETVMKAKPNSLLDKVVNQLSSSSPSGQTTSTTTAQSAAAAISKYANLFTASAAQAVKSAANANIHSSPGMGGMAYIPPQPQSNGITSPTERKTPLPPHLTLMTNTNGTPANSRPASPGGVHSPVIPSPNPGLKRHDSMRGMGDVVDDRPSKVDGGLSMLAAERMLRWHAEAVGRVVEMSQAGDVGKNVFALSKVLTEAIGRGYIEIALDSAAARLDQHDNKTDVDFESLIVLRPADQICHLWQRYTSTALFPLVGGNQAGSNTRREMGTYNSQGLVRLEGKVNAVIQKTIDAIITAFRQLLTRQKKNDYKPLNDEISFARNQTEPCELCCQLMDDMRAKAKESMSGKNLDAFFTEVGLAIHSLLLDHYKRFPVNPTGGLMLTKDLAAYQESAAGLGIPAVNDRFDMLRQLGNSFIVQPNVLKSYMTESHLGRIELKLLRPYLQQRVDYSSFAKSLNLEEGPGPLSLESDRERKMNNRLSAISGVAGAGMGKLKTLLKELEVGLTPEEQAAMRKAESQRIGYGHGGRGHYPPVYMGMH